MSPEVALGQPYGFKVDVYSFALVIYEILNLTQPFSKIKEPSSFTRTVLEGNLRPALDDDLPYTVQNLLRRMWSRDISERPSSKEVALYLEELFRGDEFGLFPPGHVWRHGGGDGGKGTNDTMNFFSYCVVLVHRCSHVKTNFYLFCKKFIYRFIQTVLRS